jgi:hypothetical protein
MFGIFLPGLKSGFFARFSPFFTYIVTTMRMKKREKRTKNPSFQNQAKNPKHALNIFFLSYESHFPRLPARPGTFIAHFSM